MNYLQWLQNIQRSILGNKIHDTDWSCVELISIHIPKTAGTSFYHTLKSEYSGSKVVRVDIDTAERIKINRIDIDDAYISPRPSVVHGHFLKDQILELSKLKHEVPIITWLRDPVERVISNYFYLSKILKDEVQEERKGLRILSKMQKTLLEYAALERNRNRQTKFLEGIEISDLAFIGFTERYEDDVQELGNILKWSNTVSVNHNATGSMYKTRVDEDIRREIARLNSADIDLYERAKKMRGL